MDSETLVEIVFVTKLYPSWYPRLVLTKLGQGMLEIVTRKAWGAMPNQWYISPIEYPASCVWVFYSGNEEECLTREECDPLVRELQRYHIEDKRDMPDFPFSFLVAPCGLIYEGRGWLYSVPEPIDRKDLMNKRFIIAYIANDYELPDKPASIAVDKLIEYGIKNNYIEMNYEKYEWKMSNMSEEELKKMEEEQEMKAQGEMEE